MLAVVPDNFRWPQAWKPLPFPEGFLGRVRSLEAELQSEVSPGHPLHQVESKVVAWNGQDPNEFLFATAKPGMPLAFVHLTWQPEQEPTWPYTVGYPDWETFRL